MNDTDCLFCKIIAGEIPCANVYEDTEFFAFLGIFPKYPGMTVVTTKQHLPSYVYETMTDEALARMHVVTKSIARAIDTALGSQRCIQVMEGFEINHAHLKLFPTYETHKDALGEGKEMRSLDELLPIAEKIKNAL